MILHQTLAFCYGFQKNDAKLRGAILGFGPLGFPIGFCENTQKVNQDLLFQICDSRFGISGFMILGFWVDCDPTEISEISTVEQIDTDQARFRFSKNQRY